MPDCVIAQLLEEVGPWLCLVSRHHVRTIWENFIICQICFNFLSLTSLGPNDKYEKQGGIEAQSCYWIEPPIDVCRSEMGTSHPLGVMRTFFRLESSHQMINTESQISVRIISEGLPGIKVT